MCIYLIHLLSFIYIMGLFVWLFVRVILQLLVVQVVWFLLQFLCLRCIARCAYVESVVSS